MLKLLWLGEGKDKGRHAVVFQRGDKLYLSGWSLTEEDFNGVQKALDRISETVETSQDPARYLVMYAHPSMFKEVGPENLPPELLERLRTQYALDSL